MKDTIKYGLKNTVIMIIISALVVGITINYKRSTVKEVANNTLDSGVVAASTITLWYCDKNLGDYIDALVLDYAEHKNIAVKAEYVSSSEILEKINKANISGEGMPDVYLISSESLGKAYLAGLTTTNLDTDMYNTDNFTQSALNAVTYSGNMRAYPLCFETGFLAFNKDYTDMVPETFDEILEFADNFDGSNYEDVKSILKWDVKELQFNYCFVGDYLQYGGECGDDNSVLSLNNGKTIEALTYYNNLYNYFSTDITKVSYEKVFDEFENGNLVYSILNSKSLKQLSADKVNFGVAVIPDMTENLTTKTLSFTTVAVVNPYGTNIDTAKEMAIYMTYENTSDISANTDYLPSRVSGEFADENEEMIYSQYEKSLGLPKLMEASDFYVQLEIAMGKIWTGEDPEEIMTELQEKMEK